MKAEELSLSDRPLLKSARNDGEHVEYKDVRRGAMWVVWGSCGCESLFGRD